ncbi:MAG: Ig-like domain-containing protein [Deltaproteobacteria bacterium]|nr:Ig-like domain-containing protein [Deltaproteobacteria bacterium]
MAGLRKYGPLFIIVCLGLLISLVTLTSCGGGGSSNNAPLPPEPSPTVPANILLGSKWSVANVDAVQAATIYAQVIAQNGKVVPDGTQIQFTADQGYWNNTQTTFVTTTMGGIASASLTFGRAITQTTQVGVTVRAMGVTGVFANTQVVFYSSATASYKLDLSATPTAIKSDGTDRSLIKVKFTNGSGVAVALAKIYLSASLGGFFPGGTPPSPLPSTSTLITDKNGEASVYYTYTNPSTIDTTVPNITALITARTCDPTSAQPVCYTDPILGQSVNLTNSVLVTLTPNVIIPGKIKLTYTNPCTAGCTPNSLTIGGYTATVTATVLDTKGNPMPAGYTVSFTATLGSITGLGVTNANGVATATLTSGYTTGTCIVTGTAGSVSDSLTIVFLQSNPLTISQTGNTFVIGTAGQITFTANGGSGNVTFSMNPGSVGGNLKLTFVTRNATLTYDGSAAKPGNIIITANDNLTGESAQATVLMTQSQLKLSQTGNTFSIGTAASIDFGAIGGSGSYTWSLTKGAVTGNFVLTSFGNAAHLAYDGGAATPGDLTVILTDSTTQETVQATVRVSRTALAVNPTYSPLTIGQATTLIFTALGGSGNYTWTPPPSAPPGMFTFNPSGNNGSTLTLIYNGQAPTPSPADYWITLKDGIDSVQSLVRLSAGAASFAGVSDNGTPIADAIIIGTAGHTHFHVTNGGSAGCTWSTPTFTTNAGAAQALPAAYTFIPNSTDCTFDLYYDGSITVPGIIAITVKDNKTGQTANVYVPVGTAGVLSVTSSSATLTIGTAASIDFSVTNGSGSFTWATSFTASGDEDFDGRGALPAGFTFVNSGKTATLAYDGSNVAAGIITVTVTDTVTKATASVNITVKSGGGVSVVSSITLNSNPAAATQLPANGSSYYTVFATALDQNGKSVPNVTITFTGNLGSFCPTLPIAGCASATGVITAVTNANGVATVYLVSSLAGTANVTASSANGITSGTLTFTFINGGQVTVNAMALTAAPATIIADGISTSTITALCRNLTNNPIPNAQVNFTVFPMGTITAQATTGPDGIATVKLTSERLNTPPPTGTVVTATTGAVTSSIPVAFTGATLVVGAAPVTVNTANLSTITATLKDAAGKPVVGQQLLLSSTAGTLSKAVGTTDTNGQVMATLGSNVAATITVTVQVSGPAGAGNIATTSVTFTNAAFTIDYTPKPSPLVVSTPVNVTLTATVTDAVGNPIAGRGITFSTTLGSLSAVNPAVCVGAGTTSVTTLTNGAGIATCYMVACNGSGTATVTALDTVTKATTLPIGIPIAASTPALVCLTSDPGGISVEAPGAPATISARVYDAGACPPGSPGNPVAGAPVSFRIISGPGGGEYLSPGLVVTGPDGLAITSLYPGTAPTSLGAPVQVTATVGGLTSNTTTVVISGAAYAVKVGYSIPNITCPTANGTITLPLTATVSDVNGNNLSEAVSVSWSTTYGVISTPTQTGIGNQAVPGVANNTLTYTDGDATEPSSITVTATAKGITGSTTINPVPSCHNLTVSSDINSFTRPTGAIATFTMTSPFSPFTVFSTTYDAGVCPGAVGINCPGNFTWPTPPCTGNTCQLNYHGTPVAAGNIHIIFQDAHNNQTTVVFPVN